MSNLKIEVVENGFIVHEYQAMGAVGKMWVFDTPEKLADHIETWGGGQMKKESLPTNSKAN